MTEETFWGAEFACAEGNILGEVVDQPDVPALYRPISDEDAISAVRDYLRRTGAEGPIVSSEMYVVDVSETGDIPKVVVAAPWHAGEKEPIGAYYRFSGSIMGSHRYCATFTSSQ